MNDVPAQCLRLPAAATWAQSLAALRNQLATLAADTKQARPDQLAVAPTTLAALDDPDAQAALRASLDEQDCGIRFLRDIPATETALPPDWPAPERVQHTRAMIRLLTALLPAEAEGGVLIPVPSPDTLPQSAARLTDLVHELALNELRTGHLVFLALAPAAEGPLSTAIGRVEFFRKHLLGTPDDLSVRAYLRVAVHGPNTSETDWQRYRAAGLQLHPIG